MVRDNGRFSNRNEGILGADNKAAVAVLLAVARRYAAGGAAGRHRAAVHDLRGGRPARRQGVRPDELRADFGFVFDHATPLGELIVAAPSYYRVDAHVHGAAAHAGIRPEAGHNAISAAAEAIASMSLGRIDDETTANVGTIAGGTLDERRGRALPRRARGAQPRRRQGR